MNGLSRALRLALPRALIWAAEWMLRDVERSVRGSDETPSELTARDERPVSPGSGRHVDRPPPPTSPAARRAQRGEIRPLAPGQHSAEASEEPPVPDRSLGALRRRLGEVKRGLSNRAARTACAVRGGAEPEWAAE